MAFLLYTATAPLLLWLIDRFVRKLSWIASLVLFVLPLGLTGSALVTDGVYGPIDHLYQEVPLKAVGPEHGVVGGARNASAIDVVSEFFPWRQAVRASWRRGEWPLWNSYNLGGHPLAAEAQAAPYSPFTLLALILPAAVSLSYSAAIGLLIAALSAFLFARELGCSEAAALFAAAGWAFAASIVVYSLTAMGLTTVYMPLLLTAVRRVVWQPAIATGAFLTTAIALTALQGHPESLFLNILVGCAYAIFELVRRRASPWRAIVTAIGAGVVAALLTAIFLLPLLEAIPQSIEYRGREGSAMLRHGVGGSEVLANLATDVFPHLHVRQWAAPKLGLIGVETAAVGSLVLAFALYAVWRKRSAETWFFAAMTLVCAIVGARWEPIADALQRVPLLSITHYERLAFAAALFLVVLAALGVEEMLRRRDFRVAAATLGGLFVFLSIGLWWLDGHVRLASSPADYGRHRVFAELFFLAAAALLLATVRRARIVVPALLALLVGQRLVSERETFATYRAADAYPPIPILEPLKEVRQPFRIVGRGGAFPPAMNTYYKLEDPRGYEALTLDPFARTWKLWCRRQGIWFNRVDDLTSPFLSFLNVRYAIQSDLLPVPDGWRKIGSQPGAMLLENERVLDRIFIPKTVVLTSASAIEIVDRMSATRDFREVAWITARTATTESANGPGRITLRSKSRGGLYGFDADMQREGWVVISSTAWKGWQATIDGRRVALNRANAAFLSVLVPAGHHIVRLRYLPWSFVVGRAITFATLLAIVVFAAVRAFLARPAVVLAPEAAPARA
jgi:membrane protein YfhO